MANTISIQVQLEGQDALNTIKGLEKGFNDLSKGAVKDVNKMDSAMSSFAGNLAAMGVAKVFDAIKDALVNSVEEFVKFEDGIVGVAKTTNFSAKEVAEFSKNVEAMAKVIPATVEELLSISTAAGQLGVTGVKNVSKFTEVIAKLGRVSNLEGEEAATVLTRILNVTGEGIDTIDTFASVIVALGNNFAATESEIANMANEIARAGSQFGISAADAAALGAALRASGVRAEEAGGVMTKAFIQINEAIEKGGKGLDLLSEATGRAGKDLKKAFKEDAAGVFRDFVAGINNAGSSTQTMADKLTLLNIKGIRVSKLIPTLSKNIGEYDRAISIAAKETENATALTEEYAQILDNTSTKQALFGNAVDELSRKLFGNLAPAFNNVLDVVTAFLEKMSATSPLEAATAQAKGLAATIKDVGETTKNVNSFLPEFLANVNSSFGDDRVARLNEELKIANAEVATLSKSSDKLSNLEGQIVLAEKALADFNAENEGMTIGETFFGKSADDAREEAEALGKLKSQLMFYNEEKQKEIRIQAEAARAAQEASVIKKELAASELEDIKLKAEEKRTFLEEIRLSAEELAMEERASQKLAKELAGTEDYDFLVLQLGKEEAARQLYIASQITDEKKRKAALGKIQSKARENEKKNEELAVKEAAAREKQKVADRATAMNTIASLQSSNSGVLFNIGKASSIALAGINVAEGVTKALAAFPPPFNFAAAAAVGAAGAVSIANIAAAKKPSAGRFAEGGIVGGNSPTGDNLTAGVNSGEVIFNKRQQENLFNAVDSGNIGGGGSNVTINNPLFLSEDSVDNIIDEINDRVEFGNKELKAS